MEFRKDDTPKHYLSNKRALEADVLGHFLGLCVSDANADVDLLLLVRHMSMRARSRIEH